MSANKQRELESSPKMEANRYRIGVLLYFRSEEGRILLIRRSKRPNIGLWCAVGGKLEMESGESPFECAKREAGEEVGIELSDSDLSLRCMLSEENYEGTGHWLMFLFEVHKRLPELPENIEEGIFGFFDVEELPALEMPPLDRSILLERILDQDAADFHVLRATEGVERFPERLKVEDSVRATGRPG